MFFWIKGDVLCDSVINKKTLNYETFARIIFKLELLLDFNFNPLI